MHHLITLEETLTGPDRAAAWDEPGMEEHSTQAHTVFPGGQAHAVTKLLTSRERASAITEGAAPSEPSPGNEQGNHLKLKGLPHLISASLLHIKPKPREIICHGIWGNQTSYIRGGLGLPSSTWMQPSRVHCTKPLERLDTSTCSFSFKWFWLSEIHVILQLSDTCVSNPRFIWHKSLL